MHRSTIIVLSPEINQPTVVYEHSCVFVWNMEKKTRDVRKDTRRSACLRLKCHKNEESAVGAVGQIQFAVSRGMMVQ